MPKPKQPKRGMAPNTGSEEIPPGATRKALEADRPSHLGGGPPIRGLVDRHASGDSGAGGTPSGLVDNVNDNLIPAEEAVA